MKTLLIYNSIDEPLKYAILEGDYSDLGGVYINAVDSDLDKVRKAVALLFDPKTGDELIRFTEDVSLVESKAWDKVAVITFLP